MKKLFQWFVYSSNDPSSVALTVRSGVSLLVLLGIDATLLGNAEEAVVGVVVAFGILFTKMTTLFGLVRKLWLSVIK